MANGRSKDVSTWEGVLARFETLQVHDPRSAIHGHDMVDLVAWVVRGFRGLRVFADRVAIERIFILLACGIAELGHFVRVTLSASSGHGSLGNTALSGRIITNDRLLTVMCA